MGGFPADPYQQVIDGSITGLKNIPFVLWNSAVDQAAGGLVGLTGLVDFDSLKVGTYGCNTGITCSWSGGTTGAALSAPGVVDGVFAGGATSLSIASRNPVANVRYIGRLEDLESVPRELTFLDDLPELGSTRLNYYQNMSVVRKALRDGVEIKDASFFRPDSELAPTRWRPDRTIRQTFLGAERNLLNNRRVPSFFEQ